jgi:hypothetical protein
VYITIFNSPAHKKSEGFHNTQVNAQAGDKMKEAAVAKRFENKEGTHPSTKRLPETEYPEAFLPT